MQKLQLTATFKIQPDKTEEFKALAASCIQIVQQQDTGTLQYDWFYSPDGLECKVRETYASSDALLEHISHVGENIGKFLEIAEFSVEMYGAPTEKLLKAIEDTATTYYSFAGGIN